MFSPPTIAVTSPVGLTETFAGLVLIHCATTFGGERLIWMLDPVCMLSSRISFGSTRIWFAGGGGGGAVTVAWYLIEPSVELLVAVRV